MKTTIWVLFFSIFLGGGFWFGTRAKNKSYGRAGISLRTEQPSVHPSINTTDSEYNGN